MDNLEIAHETASVERFTQRELERAKLLVLSDIAESLRILSGRV